MFDITIISFSFALYFFILLVLIKIKVIIDLTIVNNYIQNLSYQPLFDLYNQSPLFF